MVIPSLHLTNKESELKDKSLKYLQEEKPSLSSLSSKWCRNVINKLMICRFILFIKLLALRLTKWTIMYDKFIVAA